jgi:hypothetical protein
MVVTKSRAKDCSGSEIHDARTGALLYVTGAIWYIPINA